MDTQQMQNKNGLYIGDLDANLTKLDIAQHFQQYNVANVVYNPIIGRQ